MTYSTKIVPLFVYRVPKNKHVFSKWIHFVQQYLKPRWTPGQWSCVCSRPLHLKTLIGQDRLLVSMMALFRQSSRIHQQLSQRIKHLAIKPTEG